MQTIITEVEGVVSSRSLVYEDDNANNEIITPMYFLSFNLNNGTPILEKKYEDDDANNKIITPMYFLSFNLKNRTPVLEKK